MGFIQNCTRIFTERNQTLPGAHPENLCHAQHHVTKLGYSADVFDLEPVLIQPTYI